MRRPTAANGNGASPNGKGRKNDDEEIPEAGQRVAVNAGTRFGVGMPVERSENFGSVVRRLLHRMRPERLRVAAVLVFAVVSVTLTVIGPRILGDATNIVVEGIQSPQGIDFAELHRVLLHGARHLRRSPASCRTSRASSSPASCNGRCTELRSDVEDKLNRLPLAYIDSQPARRSAQPGHQRHRQRRPEPPADA